MTLPTSWRTEGGSAGVAATVEGAKMSLVSGLAALAVVVASPGQDAAAPQQRPEVVERLTACRAVAEARVEEIVKAL